MNSIGATVSALSDDDRSSERGAIANEKEVIAAYNNEAVTLHTIIKLRLKIGEIVDTTVGRALLYDILPEGADFTLLNKLLRKSDIAKLVEHVYFKFGAERTVQFLEKIKEYGFKNATMGGMSFPIEGLIEPKNKTTALAEAEKKVEKIEKLFKSGAITNGERENKIVSMWHHTAASIARDMYQQFEEYDQQAYENTDKSFKWFNPIFMSIDSGARGTKEQIKQLVAMRGLMSKPSGEVIETPVKSNFKHGLSVFEYFISTHGARKGQADTALKTANSGYLTRRLVDVAQDVVVTINDCGTLGYTELEDLKESGKIIHPLIRRLYGRILVADLKDGLTGEVLLKRGQLMTRVEVAAINDAYITKAAVRSVLTCQSKRGVCAQCYGMDLATGAVVEMGTAIGVIAAQSIGEPGTQLTMRTFHIGGTASLAEQTSYMAKSAGQAQFDDIRFVTNHEGQDIVVSRKGSIKILSEDGRELQDIQVPYSATFLQKKVKLLLLSKNLLKLIHTMIILSVKKKVLLNLLT